MKLLLTSARNDMAEGIMFLENKLSESEMSQVEG